MDERYRMSLLYDFYGELLSDHQKNVFSAVVFDDMSYSEAAEEFDISRQAAFDLIRRTKAKLEDYETRLQLLSRFCTAKEKMSILTDNVNEMQSALLHSAINEKEQKKLLRYLDKIRDASEEIFEEF